ncbi:PBECR2 nuclease fold domain-containing protein [Campylobacter hyointestinalis]|uniref:PBECR2 nuclease fold domain-containing protein n=1 Tax=Campylobacter hyointestinalis TaxID=198 RepID=UPI0015E1CCFF|nr:PBECR2 nuclease fold domain-containing protein [Campylobacter hyointestinalis]
MRANFIVEKMKPLIPYLGNNEALKLHLNRAILNANGDFKLAIKNIDDIPSGNLPTPTRNLLNEFKNALKDIEQVVKSQEPTQIKSENQVNLAKSINGDGFVTYPNKNIYFSDEAKFELSKELQNKTGLQDKISTSLAWLQSRHPEMFHSKRAVKEMIDFILEAPSVSQAKRANSVAMTRVSNNKINDIVVDKNKNKIIHANKRKPNSQEKADSGNALHPHSDTMSDGALKLAENQRLSANTQTIPNQTIKTAETKSTINELTKEQKAEQKAKKEIRGIHNVTYNDKKATYIKTDLENVDSAIRYANTNRDKGAKHIKIRHLMDETKPGYITNQELLNLGNSLREYIKTYKEPFIDKNGARIYEWENKEGVKFRVVVDSSRRDATTAELPQPTATDDIITFYSDRNIKDKMIFRNPKLNQTIKEAENLAKPQATPKQEPTQIKSENQVNLANQSIKGDGFVVSDENIKNLVKNISLNKYMAMQLQPKADLLNLAKDFSKVIKTPIFDSKISIDKLLNHLADKRDFNKRLEYLNLIKPTLENPLFITKENNRYRFIKTFIDSDKITKFLSVIENDNGEFL